MNSSVILPFLSALLTSPTPAFRSMGLAGLLARNDPSALTAMVQMNTSIINDPSFEFVVQTLNDEFRNASPSAVRLLISTATAYWALADLRRAAIRALVAIHSREAIPFIASLLSSADTGEQMSAVIGLSSFANGCPMQTLDNAASMEYLQFKNPSPYRTEQTIAAFAFGPVNADLRRQFVAFWTSWWNQNKTTFLNVRYSRL